MSVSAPGTSQAPHLSSGLRWEGRGNHSTQRPGAALAQLRATVSNPGSVVRAWAGPQPSCASPVTWGRLSPKHSLGEVLGTMSGTERASASVSFGAASSSSHGGGLRLSPRPGRGLPRPGRGRQQPTGLWDSCSSAQGGMGACLPSFGGHRLPCLRWGTRTLQPHCTVPGVAAAGARGLRGRVHHPDWCSHRGLRYLG